MFFLPLIAQINGDFNEPLSAKIRVICGKLKGKEKLYLILKRAVT